jgi:hypothetical protein
VREKKKKCEANVIGKDVKELNGEQMKACLGGLREVERDMDECFKKENDLNVEKINKGYQEIEREA